MRLVGGQKGFTLVEVVVALALLALLASTVLTLYLQAIVSWRQQEQAMDVQDNLRVAMDRMGREARQARSIKVYTHRIYTYENPPILVLNEGIQNEEIHYYQAGSNLYRVWQGISNPLAGRINTIGFQYDATNRILKIELEGISESGRTITLSTTISQRYNP
ncbi:prepilin-type N-terminal cleavage/methylation domain-containing protein [Neomoorella thermoacetica]|uniref:prepilin-type N-terminal cleavage/methylation domain-containing protein n=1 Tax=Neomoorella thermoacetica TaxID=1525 RepID=UPI0008FA37A5|nr:prepilin-type N-terminal cleavage/methylation domain-containing protein [Moorella thermoacetica]